MTKSSRSRGRQRLLWNTVFCVGCAECYWSNSRKRKRTRPGGRRRWESRESEFVDAARLSYSRLSKARTWGRLFSRNAADAGSQPSVGSCNRRDSRLSLEWAQEIRQLLCQGGEARRYQFASLFGSVCLQTRSCR